MIVRAVGPTSVAKGPAIDRTNRTDETLSPICPIGPVARSLPYPRTNGKTMGAKQFQAVIVLPPSSCPIEQHARKIEGSVGCIDLSGLDASVRRVGHQHRSTEFGCRGDTDAIRRNCLSGPVRRRDGCCGPFPVASKHEGILVLTWSAAHFNETQVLRSV